MLDDEACVALDLCGILVVADGRGGVEPNSKQKASTTLATTRVWKVHTWFLTLDLPTAVSLDRGWLQQDSI